MIIKRLTFEEKRGGWKLDDARFDAFNLLVGESGAGKTKIVNALRLLAATAGASAQGLAVLGDHHWTVEIDHDEHTYTWELDAAALAFPDTNVGGIISERVDVDGSCVFTRTREDVQLRGAKIPTLAGHQSAIALFNEEPFSSIRGAFDQVLYSETDVPTRGLVASFTLGVYLGARSMVDKKLMAMAAGLDSIDAVRAVPLTSPIEIKARLLRDADPKVYGSLIDLFQEIFPTIDEVELRTLSEEEAVRWRLTNAERAILFFLRERGTTEWLPPWAISSGMYRTIVHLFEIALAPSGSVIVIDEFENSLGDNCLPALTEFLRGNADHHQFILTSHHPYIINNIPMDTWKLVQRRGSTVRLVGAKDIQALQGKSHLDGFTRLMSFLESSVAEAA